MKLFLEIRHVEGSGPHAVTKADLEQLERKIMSAIKDYADKVNTAFIDISDGVDGLVSSIDGVTKDILTLKATIDKLQNSPGNITTEDQKLLDDSQTQAGKLAARIKTVATVLKELDDATAAPPEPPAPTTGDGSVPPTPTP